MTTLTDLRLSKSRMCRPRSMSSRISSGMDQSVIFGNGYKRDRTLTCDLFRNVTEKYRLSVLSN